MSKADELKAKNENLFERNTILLNENERLKKENAELRYQNTELRYQLNKNPCVRIPEWYCSDCLKENARLKRIVKMVAMINKDIYTEEGIKAIYAEAEQFLKEIEK